MAAKRRKGTAWQAAAREFEQEVTEQTEEEKSFEKCADLSYCTAKGNEEVSNDRGHTWRVAFICGIAYILKRDGKNNHLCTTFGRSAQIQGGDLPGAGASDADSYH